MKRREGKHIMDTLKKYAPDSYDPHTDDMTVPFAIQLAEKDAEIARLHSLEGDVRWEFGSGAGDTIRDARAKIEHLTAVLKTVEATMSIIPPRTMKRRYLECLNDVRATLGEG